MTLCPKCGQTSTSDKVCSNCWADLTAKPKAPKPPNDPADFKLKNIVLLGFLLIVVLYLMSMLVNSMMSNNNNNVQPQPVTVFVVATPTTFVAATPTP